MTPREKWEKVRAENPSKEALAEYLMKRYIIDEGLETAAKEFDIQKHSFIAYICKGSDLVKLNNPKLYDKYTRETKIVRLKAQGKVYIDNYVKENAKKKPVSKVIKELPKKMEYGKFLNTMCFQADTGVLSSKNLIDMAKENGILLWERMDSGKVKVY